MITLPVPREEMIDCESYYKMADYHYKNGMVDLPSGIVHVDMGSIPDFFQKINGNGQKYVVISSRSDFGLHYQQEYPPWKDYVKLAGQVICGQNTNGGYEDIVLPAPINRGKCDSRHKYSIKCYRYTHATFNEIPANVVKWFVTNNTVLDDDRIRCIPFGINGVDGNTKCGDNIYNLISMTYEGGQYYRSNKIYMNFTFYTNERVRLFELYKNEPFIVAREKTEFEQHIRELATWNYCLCPVGNGYDCYRMLESLYMGCIPIIECCDALWFYLHLDLPVLLVKSMESLSGALLEQFYNSWLNNRKTWDLTKITASYWRSQIEESRGLL